MTDLVAKYPKSVNVHAASGAWRALERNRPAAHQSYEAALAINPMRLEALAGITTLDRLAKRPQGPGA